MTPNWKPERIMGKVRRHIKRRDTKAAEDRVMQAVRREDRYCRFPMCSCGRLKLVLDVAHAGDEGHRGMGGNPSLSKTTPENLILLCRPRHRAHKFAVDKKTLKIEPLTDAGTRGPVRWLIDHIAVASAVGMDVRDDNGQVLRSDMSYVLATETRPHVFEPFTEAQKAILTLLAEMKC